MALQREPVPVLRGSTGRKPYCSQIPLRSCGSCRRKHLDSDIAIELGVSRAIHLAHSARPDRADDFVRGGSVP